MIAGSVQMFRNSGDKALIIREAVPHDDHTLGGDFIPKNAEFCFLALKAPSLSSTPACAAPTQRTRFKKSLPHCFDSFARHCAGIPDLKVQIATSLPLEQFFPPSRLAILTVVNLEAVCC
jgi:hypothetical protein